MKSVGQIFNGKRRHNVTEIEAEQALVDSTKKLIEIYEQKTKDCIAKVWGRNNR